MNRYEVTDRSAQFGSGMVLELEPGQVEVRKHNLRIEKVNPKTKRITVTVINPVQFKRGEIVHLPHLPRHLEKALDLAVGKSIEASGEAKPAPAAAAQAAAVKPVESAQK